MDIDILYVGSYVPSYEMSLLATGENLKTNPNTICNSPVRLYKIWISIPWLQYFWISPEQNVCTACISKDG